MTYRVRSIDDPSTWAKFHGWVCVNPIYVIGQMFFFCFVFQFGRVQNVKAHDKKKQCIARNAPNNYFSVGFLVSINLGNL